MSEWEETEWRTAYFCALCEKRVAHDDRFSRAGRCPHCGDVHPRAFGIVQCNERAYKLRYRPVPWWKFWAEEESYVIWKDLPPEQDINSPHFDPLSGRAKTAEKLQTKD